MQALESRAEWGNVQSKQKLARALLSTQAKWKENK